VILKVSHNLHAGMLPILVSLKQGVGVLEDGMRRQEAFLRGLGVDTGSISLGGGVGGHRADCVTVRATVSLLRAMAKRPDFPVYRNALPILGVDGTLATVVPPTSPARGKVQAKTGTLVYANTMSGSWLLNSKALAGYMTTAKNREVAFALFVNNVPMKEKSGSTAVGRTLGSICEALYDMF
jgi:D-alanyl-D-alanine carboxypeptidase/D-alanyl-D-alanine-endopeptidase (penicillin-binding protein 4)